MTEILIDGYTLTADQVLAVARDPSIKVGLAQSSRDALAESRAYIEANWMHDEAPMMYSFNTGVGLLKDTRISVDHIALFQTQMIRAHAAGMGDLQRNGQLGARVAGAVGVHELERVDRRAGPRSGPT